LQFQAEMFRRIKEATRGGLHGPAPGGALRARSLAKSASIP
jgi:hypothetical protein